MNAHVETVQLMLPETLDLAASESFLEQVRQAVIGDRPLCMDASAVNTLTLPCAQIILAATRSGDSIKIKDPSEAFANAFDDLGIDWKCFLDRSQPSEQDQSQDASRRQDGAENSAGADQQAAASDDKDETQDPAGQDDLKPISETAMSKRILTIDDSKTMRDMLMLTLSDAGFDVLQAVDGQDGLDVLVNEQVDVIITDINMPRMDGYEVIRNLRRDPAHKSTPILVLTTESETEKKNLARQAGATGWMVKPFDPDRLVATVLKVAP